MDINCQDLSMPLDCSNPKTWFLYFVVYCKGMQRLFRMPLKYHPDYADAKCTV
jgi:hypothetical protein